MLGSDDPQCEVDSCEDLSNTWYTDSRIECFKCRESLQGPTKKAECTHDDDCQHYADWDGANCSMDGVEAPMNKCFNWREGARPIFIHHVVGAHGAASSKKARREARLQGRERRRG